ncbi:Hypothetical predicted protein [Mytilus galloprovincialis]|uniref:TRIM56 n=1 Tax=Mytilus galloprovincialis TaxID=29158 RepID=A0A8B6FXV1_MYTGA|nr:Hypothetical predicted protein [Mytilus galloprovincialis]VDI72407.1 Hypothetical predicted protein [Mytilus galloprovincialis]
MAAAMLTSMSYTKDLPETINDLTKCPICLDTLKVPKYFTCLHTFCSSCIHTCIEHLFKDHIPRSISCPVCRTKIKVSDKTRNAEEFSRKLPINHIILSLIDAQKMLKGKSICGPCKKLHGNKVTAAKVFCVECREAFCNSCSKYHKAFSAFIDHELADIDKVSDVHLKIGSQYTTCNEHMKKIEVYCNDHQKPCCLHCVTLEHRKCNEVVAIEEAAKKLRDSDAYLNLMNAFSTLTRNFSKAVEEREELLFVGEREEKETKEKIKTIRKNIEKLVLKLEQDCLDQLSISCRDNQLVLSESIEHFKEKTKMVLHCQNMLKAGLKCNSDIQLLYDYNNMKAQKEELESFLQVNEQQKYSKFAFEINGAMENMTNQITSLGNVVISEATLITSNSSLLDCSIRPLQDLDLLHENSFYKKEAKFSGVTCHDDMILLVDRYKYWLYIFSDETDEIYYGRVKLSIQDALTFSIPWDVSGTLKGRCVVSFPESSVLADICINSCTINRWIQINNPQIGISFYSNSIVSCHRYDGKSADVVTIFDMNGNVIREHKHGCKPNYLCIDDVGRIFFNDRDENKLTCITYNFEEVFTYKHEQLRGIAGIATDTEGNIYVAGFNSNNVHQLSPSGQLNKIILTEAHDIINPLGISFKKDADILIVLNDSGSRVSMYEIY